MLGDKLKMEREYMDNRAHVDQSTGQPSATGVARGYIQHKIKTLRDEAYRYETLLRELPCMSPEADRALFESIVR